MIKLFLKYGLYGFLFLAKLSAFAHGEDEHGGNTTSAIKPKSYFYAIANSDKYELLLKYKPIHPGEETVMQLFISEYNTNKPIDKAEIKISFVDNSNQQFRITETKDPGIYNVKVIFAERKSYTIKVNLNSKIGPDLMVLKDIVVGKELPVVEKEVSPHNPYNSFLMIGLGVLIGLILMLIGNKLFRKNAKVTLFIVLTFFSSSPIPNPLMAHEGHDSGGRKGGDNISNSINVTKETQFLFEVLTQKIEVGNFAASTKLYGTIIPASNGQALVNIPTNGKIVALYVKVGQNVKKGDELAVIEMNLDAGAQINYMAEKNNVEAEYEAAKKDYDNLQKIADIASKKDLAEATARFRKAAENRKLFSSGVGKSLILRSPIDGIIGNFTLTIGATVSGNETIFTITNLSNVYVEAQVFDKDADQIKDGVKYTVECTTDIHKTAEVKLLSLAQSINSSNQSQRVLFTMENTESGFKIGEFVNIRVFADKNSRDIYVPNSAISEINGKPVVFIKDDAEQYSLSYVSLGENNGAYTTLKKGVEENERVVVNGTYQLKMIYLNQ